MYRKYGLQRLWLIAASAIIFSLAQLCALTVENPNWLWLVSSLSGLGYGVLFGVYPTIVSGLIPNAYAQPFFIHAFFPSLQRSYSP